ncbi:hypothetical protein BH24GEM2_BH24GEM2_00560 [soil metagenome]|jgi:hypothetical protein
MMRSKPIAPVLTTLLLFAWAPQGQAQTKTLAERAAEAAAAAARLRDGLRNAAAPSRVSEVAGTYNLTEFYGKPLPASAPAEGTAGQPCPGGGKAVSAAIASGFVQLQADGMALMRATALITCQMPNGTTRTADLPQDLNGRYSVADKQVKIAMGRNGTITLTHDAAGTLRWKDAGALWRKQGAVGATNTEPRAGSAPAQPHGALNSVLRQAEATVDPKRTPKAIATSANEQTTPFGRIEGVGDPASPLFMIFQSDGAIQFPIARMGDSVFIYNLKTKQATAAKVIDLRAVESNCPEGWPRSGWAYAVSQPLAPIVGAEQRSRGEGEPSNLAVFGRRITFPSHVSPPPALLKILQAAHMAELTREFNELRKSYPEYRERIREAVMGDAAYRRLEGKAVRSVRVGPQTIYAIGYDGDDPIDDVGGAVPYSLLYNGAGKFLGRIDDVDVRTAHVVEMTGDDTDELLVPDTGQVAHYRNGAWKTIGRDLTDYHPCY